VQPGLGCSKALAAPPDLVERSTGRNRMVDGRLVHEAMARPGRRRTDGAARQLCGSNRRRFAWDDRRQPFRCARALVNKPDVLLMDEPLANLDSLTRFAMQDELLALWQRERFTAFLVTHDVEEALYLAGRVLVLSPRRRAFWPTSRLTYPIRDIAAVWSSRNCVAVCWRRLVYRCAVHRDGFNACNAMSTAWCLILIRSFVAS